MNKLISSVLLFSLMITISQLTIANEKSEREAVLAVVQQTFDAITSRDPTVWKTVMLEEGVAIGMSPDADSDDGEFKMHLRRNMELIENMAPNGQHYLEQFTAEPKVLIHQAIAVVWGEYDFWIDGEFSHCGIDSIDLVKAGGQWKIANLMWTMERENCPTDTKGKAG